ncbi:MAG: ABC transporter ATP-binding protein [Dehalococcoidia bacterium]|nr:ABC transporter ATP-binding protein [Dehalococcoidia bacterium]
MNRVSFAYCNGLVIRDMNLCLRTGEMVGLIGPNGAGKTTVIKLISGILSPSQGQVRVHGADTRRLSRAEMAMRVAVVPQQFDTPYAYSAEEVVMLGRTPFMRPFRDYSEKDCAAVRAAMSVLGISHLRDRRFGSLSGGERQKVVLAMALAQETEVVLLDEPTAHLDISHQVEMLELLAEANAKRGLTVLAATHDLNLASSYFKRLILMREGVVVADGPPDEVITPGIIEASYHVPVRVQAHPVTGVPQVIVLPPGNGHR